MSGYRQQRGELRAALVGSGQVAQALARQVDVRHER